MTLRTASQRRRDALDALRRGDDVWVASPNGDRTAHLIALSYLWHGTRLTMATPLASKTARNLMRAGWARVALASTRDVVIVEGAITTTAIDANGTLRRAHAEATGFDAGAEPEEYAFLQLAVSRMEAWRDVEELKGRAIMRHGRWVDD